jgi:hypothetical protein
MRRYFLPFLPVLLLASFVLACGDDKTPAVTINNNVAQAAGTSPTTGGNTPSCTPAAKAAASVAKAVTVCGKVGDASYQASTSGRPTFINFDKPYPNHSFVALIWGENRSRFNPVPEQQFGAGKTVCVSGTVEMYRGKPQIIVRDPGAIKVC